MAKVITKTTAKVSTTHNRVAVVVKYPNGEVLKTASNRGSDSFSVNRPLGFNETFGKLDIKSLFKFICQPINLNETHGDRFERLAKFFESTNSVQEAIDKARA